MKTSLTLTIALFLGIQIPFIGSTFKTTLPEGAQVLTKEDFVAYLKSNNWATTLSKSFYLLKEDKIKFYKIGNVVLEIWELERSDDDNRTLQQQKLELQEVLSKSTVSTFKEPLISKGPQLNFLTYIRERIDGSLVSLTFHSAPFKGKTIDGTIECKPQDISSAKAILRAIVLTTQTL